MFKVAGVQYSQHGSNAASRNQREVIKRKTLALALSYVRRFPEVLDGEVLRGRIRLDKRPEFILDVTKLMVPDDRLRALVLEKRTRSENDERDRIDSIRKSDKIAVYCLDKNNGSRDAALLELNAITSRLSGEGQRVLKLEDILALRSVRRMPKKMALQFASGLGHMVYSVLQVLISTVDGAVGRLEEAQK